MSFGELLADLDATVFDQLSDDRSALWSREDGQTYILAAMIDGGEKQHSPAGMPSVSAGTMVRLSAAEVAAKLNGSATQLPDRPIAGEQFTILGRRFIVHGDAWLDDASGGRDWLCAVTAA